MRKLICIFYLMILQNVAQAQCNLDGSYISVNDDTTSNYSGTATFIVCEKDYIDLKLNNFSGSCDVFRWHIHSDEFDTIINPDSLPYIGSLHTIVFNSVDTFDVQLIGTSCEDPGVCSWPDINFKIITQKCPTSIQLVPLNTCNVSADTSYEAKTCIDFPLQVLVKSRSSTVNSQDSYYIYDFDDGTTISGREYLTAAHVYNVAGTYDIKVLVIIWSDDKFTKRDTLIDVLRVRVFDEDSCLASRCRGEICLHWDIIVTPSNDDAEHLTNNPGDGHSRVNETTVCLGLPIEFNLEGFRAENVCSTHWYVLTSTDTIFDIEGDKLTYEFPSTGSYWVYFENTCAYFPNDTCNWFTMSYDSLVVNVVDNEACKIPPCCSNSFAPVPGEKYVLSGWVKENFNKKVLNYPDGTIILEFQLTGGGMQRLGPYFPKGIITDGWQQIQEVFTVPSTASKIKINLNNNSDKEVFFDDIRISPFDASMKSFVYDPVTLKLAAELDERNYATFYEYDEDGALVRVKKETERGIKTIQESKNSNKKK